MKSPRWFLWVLAIGIVWSGKAIAQTMAEMEAIVAPAEIKKIAFTVEEGIAEREKGTGDFVYRCRTLPFRAIVPLGERLIAVHGMEFLEFDKAVRDHLGRRLEVVGPDGQFIEERFKEIEDDRKEATWRKDIPEVSLIKATLDDLGVRRELAVTAFRQATDKCPAAYLYGEAMRLIGVDQREMIKRLLGVSPQSRTWELAP
ncbi:MAG: hypothetical protein HY459_02525 [Parcubacteria group bacterium]|nr:hypothetical protein [Parcubacteria group bacterium]